jgi:hypothetical protein
MTKKKKPQKSNNNQNKHESKYAIAASSGLDFQPKSTSPPNSSQNSETSSGNLYPIGGIGILKSIPRIETGPLMPGLDQSKS